MMKRGREDSASDRPRRGALCSLSLSLSLCLSSSLSSLSALSLLSFFPLSPAPLALSPLHPFAQTEQSAGAGCASCCPIACSPFCSRCSPRRTAIGFSAGVCSVREQALPCSRRFGRRERARRLPRRSARPLCPSSVCRRLSRWSCSSALRTYQRTRPISSAR